MRAGTLRHRIEIQEATPYTNELNEEVPGKLKTIAKRWASIRPLSGREFFEAQRVQSEVSYVIEFRLFLELTSKMILIANGVRLEIESVLHDRGPLYKTIAMCKEVT